MARPEAAPKTALAARMREIRRKFGDPDRDQWAETLGVSKNTIASYEKGDTDPTAAIMAELCEQFGVSVRWLVMGKGPMLEDNSKLPEPPITIAADFALQLKDAMERMTAAAQNFSQAQPRELIVEHYEPKTVKYYPTIHASAGGGLAALVESPGYDLDVEGLARVLFGVEQRDLFFLPVRGDSMLPTFAHGDIAVIERWRGVGEIEDNRIYVVSLDGDIYVKRAMWELDGLKWLSDNELPQYEPILVPKDRINDMNVLGEVLWRLQPIRKKKA